MLQLKPREDKTEISFSRKAGELWKILRVIRGDDQVIVNQNWRVTILTRAWIIPEEGDQRPLLFVLWLLVQWKPISPGFVIIIWLVMILCQPHLVWYKRADGCMLLISDMSVGAAQFCDFQSEQIWRGKSVFLSCKSCSKKAGFSYQQLVLSRSQWVKSDIVCTTPS